MKSFRCRRQTEGRNEDCRRHHSQMKRARQCQREAFRPSRSDRRGKQCEDRRRPPLRCRQGGCWQGGCWQRGCGRRSAMREAWAEGVRNLTALVDGQKQAADSDGFVVRDVPLGGHSISCAAQRGEDLRLRHAGSARDFERRIDLGGCPGHKSQASAEAKPLPNPFGC